MEDIKKTYDDILYISKSYKATLPNRQASILTLLGFDAPDIKKARVLEIGCSFGGNILSFALANEESECIGIDLSSKQIEEGKKIIQKLGIKNLELIEMDVTKFDKSLGKFDYIICHGVFSWVPENVQEAILEVIKNHLTENGSAVISYNTYPGWKDLDILKDIMQFRTSYLDIEETQKVSYGKGALEFLKESPYINNVTKRINDILDKDDYYLYHEYFELYNKPMYLYQFNNLVENKGLRYISDSSFSKTFYLLNNDELEEKLDIESNGNNVIKEQYYDYYLNTQFRISIITHKENKEDLKISKDFLKENMDKLNYSYFNKKINEEKYKKDEIFKMIYENYPNTITIKELIEKTGYDENDIYKKILSYIYQEKVNVFTHKINIENKDKIKLKERYRKYFEYHLNNENPLISFSAFDGSVINVKKIEIMIILLFDGIKTDEEIIDILLEKEKSEEINISYENKLEGIKSYLKDIKSFFINYRFAE